MILRCNLLKQYQKVYHKEPKLRETFGKDILNQFWSPSSRFFNKEQTIKLYTDFKIKIKGQDEIEDMYEIISYTLTVFYGFNLIEDNCDKLIQNVINKLLNKINYEIDFTKFDFVRFVLIFRELIANYSVIEDILQEFIKRKIIFKVDL